MIATSVAPALAGIVGFGTLEWSFVAALVVLVGAAGVFGLFLVANLFRNPSRRH